MVFFCKKREEVKRSNVEITESILRYLLKKKEATQKEIKEALKIDDNEFVLAISTLFDQKGSQYISIIAKEKELWQLTNEGSEYLRGLDLQKLQEQQTKFNRVIALTGIIIALATLWTFSNEFANKYSNRQLNSVEWIAFPIGTLVILCLAFLLGRETVLIYKG